jgi:solute carrier family 25 folate transporter 32
LAHIVLQFLAYETLKKTYQTHVSPEMSVPPTLAIGAMAQVFASTTTYPYQVIKARLQQGGPNALHYTGTWDCIQKIIR